MIQRTGRVPYVGQNLHVGLNLRAGRELGTDRDGGDARPCQAQALERCDCDLGVNAVGVGQPAEVDDGSVCDAGAIDRNVAS